MNDKSASRDAMGRRSRLQPASTGKRVSLTDRDWVWLKCLAEHGPLSSSFLLAFAGDLRVSEKRARERLTDLFNEDNTPHGGAYLTRPPQQFHTLDSRYNQLVYDLAPAGKRALRDLSIVPSRNAGPWLHRYMVSSITASIELAINGRDDLRFIPQSAILSRAETDLETAVTIPTMTRSIKLIPDALFGIEHRTSKGSRFRFFVVEADRATEPLTSTNFNRKSALRSLHAYHAYIGAGRYQGHLKLTAPLLVLNVSSDLARTQKTVALYERTVSDGISYQLFLAWSAFAPPFRPPEPNTDLLQGEWRRAGKGPFRIDRL